MVTHVLLDEAIAIVTADNWVGQVQVFDLGLQLAAVLFRDLATEDDGDLVWLTMVRLASRSRSPNLPADERSGCRRFDL